MALRLSTGFRDAQANSQFNAGAGASFDSGVLEFRTGTQPASANDAPTGTLLVSMTLPADAFGASSSGVVSKAGTWEDTSADAAGDAGWFRLRTSTDGGGSSTTDRRIDGAITATGGGGQIELNNITIAAAQQVTQNTFAVTHPAS
jgi:hypothetical protein